MTQAETIAQIQQKYQPLKELFNERVRRAWAATEAAAIGWGGISIVAVATGLSRTTITAALHELKEGERPRQFAPLVRRAGGGRHALCNHDPTLVQDLESLLEPYTRGDPESPLRWTCKSIRKLSRELQQKQHQIGTTKVGELLHDLHYSLQSNRKTREGSTHPDRNAQFEYIAHRTQEFQQRGHPVISVDAKKKELIGQFKNAGQEWSRQGVPEAVEVYDFLCRAKGKGIPYGVYDQTANQGWVSVGTDHDTAEFAGETITRWWEKMGHQRYATATDLLITADGGGSNSRRSRLWKIVLQQLADQTGLRISMCHFPPGTSKWNKIEHRMFAYITQNWRGKPLISHEVMVNLIANTTTETGLMINAEVDSKHYAIGRKISKEEFMQIHMTTADFHGEWNYQIHPR